MQPLFFVVLKKLFVKTGTGRKHRRSVMPWIYHNKSTNGKSLSVGFRKLDPPDRLKNVSHPGCGGNPAKHVPKEPRDPGLDQLQVWSLHL